MNDTLDALADSLVTALKCSYKHIDRSPIIEESYDTVAQCGSIWGSIYGSHVTPYPPHNNRPPLPPIEKSEIEFLSMVSQLNLFGYDIGMINDLRRALGYSPLSSGSTIMDLIALHSDERDGWDI